MRQIPPSNPFVDLFECASRIASVLIVLAFWFGVGLLAMMFTSYIADSLIEAIFGVSLSLKFCLWLAADIGPYDSLIDPLPFNFACGLSGGAVAVMLKVRGLMDAVSGEQRNTIDAERAS